MTDMLQKSENVAKNVANENSQDLTEKYKHGNLPDDRFYYYRFKGEPEVQITTQYGLYCEEADNKKEIEVIDFVPSYEEYDKLWQVNKEVANRNIDLIIKLNTLKELLKEWVQFEIEENPNDFTVMSERMSELANKTKEVLKCH